MEIEIGKNEEACAVAEGEGEGEAVEEEGETMNMVAVEETTTVKTAISEAVVVDTKTKLLVQVEDMASDTTTAVAMEPLPLLLPTADRLLVVMVEDRPDMAYLPALLHLLLLPYVYIFSVLTRSLQFYVACRRPTRTGAESTTGKGKLCIHSSQC